MKNLFRLSTGIVFIISILIAVGCGPKRGNKEEPVTIEETVTIEDTVFIFITYYEINGEIHLKMFDSKGNWAIDNLTTYVMPENRVIWKLDTLCGFKDFIHIKGIPNGNIFKGVVLKPDREQTGKQLKLYLKNDIKGKEEYEIKVKMKNNDEYTLDPMLRVPSV